MCHMIGHPPRERWSGWGESQRLELVETERMAGRVTKVGQLGTSGRGCSCYYYSVTTTNTSFLFSLVVWEFHRLTLWIPRPRKVPGLCHHRLH